MTLVSGIFVITYAERSTREISLNTLALACAVILHPQWTSSEQTLADSGGVFQSGCNIPSFRVQSQPLGFVSTSLNTKACPHAWPSWYTALWTCWSKANWVSGSPCMAYPFFVEQMFSGIIHFVRAACSVINQEHTFLNTVVVWQFNEVSKGPCASS